MKRLLLLGILGVPPCAFAEPDIDKCLASSDDKAKQKECIFREFDYKPQAQKIPAEDKKPPAAAEPAPLFSFSLNDDATISNSGDATLGTKAGTITATQTDGAAYGAVKLGAVLMANIEGAETWQPFAAAAWTRDSPAKNPKDVRDFSIGLNGALWNMAGRSWTIDLTPRLIRRIDIVGHSRSNILQLHGDIISTYAGTVKNGDNSYSLIPQFGVLNENRINEKSDSGVWRGGYVGFLSTALLNGILPRLSFKAQYQYFRDFTAPAGNSRRSDGYGKVSLNYDFVDPDNKALNVYPSVGLAREVGIDPVLGVNQVNTTKLTIGFKIQYK
ncbi:hypothetical protein HBH1_03896 [Herbaspirillum sp. BH-1]|uniref:hypothetical protein n=1 Tax=Herbaspirillum sp. (strain BH-1) TaxID=2058884 RepID=UPI000C886411|nr:hypothetical protein [Herbaspirillum sp. BH-1]PLY57866.1 hypothetical protein HBH1_03896 [Herbaspirillum sp. BH-1]